MKERHLIEVIFHFISFFVSLLVHINCENINISSIALPGYLIDSKSSLD